MSRRSRRRHHDDEAAALALYDATARDAAARVIARYSTSFGLGTRILPRAERAHIRAVYAMVRVADEIVDTYRGDDAGEQLARFEDEVHRAMDAGFSSDLVAHAFALTAREVGITREQTEPFFASMRMDLTRTAHDEDSLARYIFGSAEVVGEMCLAVFVNTGLGPRPLAPDVRAGARRLGAAYQKVNFLRDLATDDGDLGRSYFPGVTAATLDDARLAGLVAGCRADIAAAEETLDALPPRARAAVGTTIDIYGRLLDQIAATPARRLVTRRVRVPNPVKATLAARNLATSRRRTA
ncbi:squalene/phytoene synthase family protein [Demequina sp. SYSU T00192]|uniref:Squalene/phytoene synthase family protein n=1 Tax=Demequina litoralis TaxID=3051660 RepID=A0ABT8GAD3_9MICO|nr:squalene/phytoene synthase family protein [Demequina sp. SYSU T00192]MDN4476099.1 squalene/phytoene synthase family protein [Demequina sp. SYSU T00192]